LRTAYPIVPLGKILTRRKEEIGVEDDGEYARLTIRLNGQGIVLRDRVAGSRIGTKRQFIARAGQLVLSKIDARNGAFGILPADCDGAIITGNFWAFEVNTALLEPLFLRYFTTTPLFIDFCIRASEGTTNRRYLQESRFLNQSVPLPPIAAQRRCIERIQEIEKRVLRIHQLRDESTIILDNLLLDAHRQIAKDAPKRPLGEIAPLNRRPVNLEMGRSYPQIAVRSFGRGTMHKPPISCEEITWQKLYLVREGDILVSNIKAWEGALAVADHDDDGRVGSHRYLTFVPREGIATARFICFYLLSPAGLKEVSDASPGSADRNRTLNVSPFLNIQIPSPSYSAQRRFDEIYRRAIDARRRRMHTSDDLQLVIPAVVKRAFDGAL
jgi:type I restriction enzyme, S subunit